MAHPKLILLVKFKSSLSLDELMAIVESRADEFRALDGLIQKHYIHDAVTGEYGGLYLWDSPEAFNAYRESELRATIGAAYKTQGEPSIQVHRPSLDLPSGQMSSIDLQRERLFNELAEEFSTFDRLGHLVQTMQSKRYTPILHANAQNIDTDWLTNKQ